MKTQPIVSDSEFQMFQQSVTKRTLELAKIAGRAPHQIRQADYEQAKREIRNYKSQFVR